MKIKNLINKNSLKIKNYKFQIRQILPSREGLKEGIRDFRKLKIAEKALVLAYIFVFLFGNFAPYVGQLNTKYQIPNTGNTAVLPNPSNGEKVANGVWKNPPKAPKIVPDPIKQVISQTKENLNLKEKSITNLQNDTFRWSVSLSNGTKFMFGKKTKDGILPVVTIENKNKQFISYSPKYEIQNTKYNYVFPRVEKNVISWEIAKGITARYTMMNDRVKEDLIVDSKETLDKNPLDFNIDYGQVDPKPASPTGGSSIINHKSLIMESMPNGDIAFLNKTDLSEIFTIPAPVINESPNTKYKIQNTNSWGGSYLLSNNNSVISIVLPKDKIERANFPITVDPVTIDGLAVTTATEYSNGRKILRDAWGNLIALFDGGLGNDNVWYKNYSATTWTDANVDTDADSALYSKHIAADIDSNQKVHYLTEATDLASNCAFYYGKLTPTRNSKNAITSISAGIRLWIDHSCGLALRPSLIIANKGGGAGVEKVAVAYAMDDTATARSEIRFMQCDVVNNCTTAANWQNASGEINGSGSCSDTATSGAAGLPNAVACKGTADKIFSVPTTFNDHQAVLTQIPGKPKRSPTSVVKDINSVQTTLTNVNDNNTGTTDTVNSLTTTDYIYIGDTKPFSKATFDLTNTNSNAVTFTTAEYCSVQSGGTCSTWASLSNFVDNTATATIAFSEDGSLIFDEPSNWVTATINGITGKYWIRIRPSGAMDATVSIAEIYITDRNSKALMVVGGVEFLSDLGAAYVVWDEVSNAGWENNPASVGAPWRENIIALSTTGFYPFVFTNYILSAATDYVNNLTYVGYMQGTSVGASNITIKSIPNNKDVTVAANWTNTAFPATAETATTNLSLTTDGQNLYIFYVLNQASTNSLVYQKCNPAKAGLGTICDNASDWENAAILDPLANSTYPQTVVTKVNGDTIAIDTIFTSTGGSGAIKYQRVYVNSSDASSPIVAAASGDDASETIVDPSSDSQVINFTTTAVGFNAGTSTTDHSGFRFNSVSVAQGSRISSAYIDLVVVSNISTNTPEFSIYGEDVDSSSSFVLVNDPCDSTCVQNRTRTTSSYAINQVFSNNTYRFDITNIVQEIVCRGASNSQPCVGNFNKSGAWASGNAISLLFINTDAAGGTSRVTFGTFDGTNFVKPTLQINVTPSGTAGKSYSLGSATQLATGSASFINLDHPFSTNEFAAVASNDTLYASVSATTNYASQSAQPAFMFKVNNSNNSNSYKINAQAIVKSTVPTSTNPVYLQVYRGGGTNDWVTMATNNNTAADTDFTLAPSSTIGSTEYFFNETPGIGSQYAACTSGTANCWTYWRVYQDNPTTTLNAVLAVNYVNVTFTQIVPDKIAFSNTARTLIRGACNGAASVFVMELQEGSMSGDPLTTTVIRVTSNSSSYTIYSDDTCSTTVTNGDFTYTTLENSKNVYIIDNKKSIVTRTLSGTRQSGDTLTTGTQDYTVDAGSVTRLVITLPGETFTDGVGNSGTVLHQPSSSPFNISISATDSLFNLNTSYTGDKTLVFSGPNIGIATPTVTDKNSVNQNYGTNTVITFSNGTAPSVTTTLYKGESTTITATDTGSYGYASSTLAVDAPSASLKGGVIIRGGTTIR